MGKSWFFLGDKSKLYFFIHRYKTLRKKQYTILVSLAVCDLLKVVVIVSMIVYSLVENTQQLCEGTSTLGTTLLFINTLHLAGKWISYSFIYFFGGEQGPFNSKPGILWFVEGSQKRKIEMGNSILDILLKFERAFCPSLYMKYQINAERKNIYSGTS